MALKIFPPVEMRGPGLCIPILGWGCDLGWGRPPPLKGNGSSPSCQLPILPQTREKMLQLRPWTLAICHSTPASLRHLLHKVGLGSARGFTLKTYTRKSRAGETPQQVKCLVQKREDWRSVPTLKKLGMLAPVCNLSADGSRTGES